MTVNNLRDRMSVESAAQKMGQKYHKSPFYCVFLLFFPLGISTRLHRHFLIIHKAQVNGETRKNMRQPRQRLLKRLQIRMATPVESFVDVSENMEKEE